MIDQSIIILGDAHDVLGQDLQDFFVAGDSGLVVIVDDLVDDAVLVDSVLRAAVFSIDNFFALGNGNALSVGVLPGLGSAADPAFHQVRVGAVIDSVRDVTDTGHIVVSGHIAHLVALVVIPLLAFADLEGPLLAQNGLAVVVDVLFVLDAPLGGAAGDDVAVLIVLNQGIDAVSTDDQVGGSTGRQVVQGGQLRGIGAVIDLILASNTAVGTNVGAFDLRGGVSIGVGVGLIVVSGLIAVVSGGIVVAAASQARQNHHSSHQQSQILLHVLLSPFTFLQNLSARL